MSQDHETPRRSPGRPPSKTARDKALRAAHDLLMKEGFGRLSIEAVAARSGVGKPTIYRNWSNASELAMAALMIGDRDEDMAPGVDLRSALEAQLCSLTRAFATTRGRQITMTLAAADPESEFTKAFRNRVILSSREHGRKLIDRAIQSGEIARVHDLEVILDMIYGPIFYRLLVGHCPLDETLGRSIAKFAVGSITSMTA
jgi:AcrR family transcriptional regulator